MRTAIASITPLGAAVGGVVLHRHPGHVRGVNRRPVDLESLHRSVCFEPDPIAYHPIASSPVPQQILHVPRHVDELEPLGDPDGDGPAKIRKRKGDLEPSLRGG